MRPGVRASQAAQLIHLKAARVRGEEDIGMMQAAAGRPLGRGQPHRKIGIALGSGAARGWAHIGVLRALDAAGIVPDIVCGTSIGAVAGALYVEGRLARLEDWARRLDRVRLRRLFDFHFGSGGLIAGERIARALKPALQDLTIERMARRFACVATDLRTGEEVWLQQGSVIDALRASYAVPGIFPPVEIRGQRLIDGALSNPVPVSLCRALGASLVIGVNVNTGILPGADDGAEDRLDLHAHGAGVVHGFLARHGGGMSVFGVLTRSLNIIQDRICRLRLAQDPADVTIEPEVGHVGPLDFDGAANSIRAGAAAAAKMIPALRAAIHASAAAAATGAQNRLS